MDVRIKGFIAEKPHFVIEFSDDEDEQGMEHSGCYDSRKVADENHSSICLTQKT
jgi:hypothetical protein